MGPVSSREGYERGKGIALHRPGAVSSVRIRLEPFDLCCSIKPVKAATRRMRTRTASVLGLVAGLTCAVRVQPSAIAEWIRTASAKLQRADDSLDVSLTLPDDRDDGSVSQSIAAEHLLCAHPNRACPSSLPVCQRHN